MDINQPFFVFDVESNGLFGGGFAVAGGISIKGKFGPFAQFHFSTAPGNAVAGDEEDTKWVAENVKLVIPDRIGQVFPNVQELRHAFWSYWCQAKLRSPNILMAAECLWPVEGKFLNDCIADNATRKWMGPYPFVEISTMMLAAGMNPKATYGREPNELPMHDPLADARQSARLLHTAITFINSNTHQDEY